MTVLEELMESFDDYQRESQNESITIEKLKEVIKNEFLEKEKKQIDDFVEKQVDLIYELFNKPTIELKPLEDLWRKENKKNKFTIPDTTTFYKWIRLKILKV